MATLDIISVAADTVTVEAGARWSSLLNATLSNQLTPPVLTDYLELSVAGTLSVGGVGGASPHYGAQVDNVLELEVVTGTGERVVCSAAQLPGCSTPSWRALAGAPYWCGRRFGSCRRPPTCGITSCSTRLSTP